jgi:phosphoribosylamine--glycine ligase
VKNSFLFHAGTALKNDTVVTNGGRVIAITSYGQNLKDALDKSYESAAHVQYEGKYYRKDIGFEFL